MPSTHLIPSDIPPTHHPSDAQSSFHPSSYPSLLQAAVPLPAARALHLAVPQTIRDVPPAQAHRSFGPGERLDRGACTASSDALCSYHESHSTMWSQNQRDTHVTPCHTLFLNQPPTTHHQPNSYASPRAAAVRTGRRGPSAPQTPPAAAPAPHR